jgi:hypothetical protein
MTTRDDILESISFLYTISKQVPTLFFFSRNLKSKRNGTEWNGALAAER